ncbi:hypothetical protein K505DRAFT_315761 [Melanomma pulvis-pyrius CBS 109.77]|uniref:BZIP domain-containing protein n=1 Tax=Melanomma pulvis-pyrius CBS 109.77 TaxID=1314802 RepID=A0A6A6WVM0_9PLEO|nr:hypothetical protein K505DRAFT_315761 [Melanomma pulvis-pyrius CBS 109.77]
MVSAHQLTPPPTLDPAPASTIKMEDLAMSSPSFSSPPPAASQPPPSTSESRAAAKKRKSWGQVLPEPKTNLPPRKRAKTEDEKEQRRIERVKRNRLAAHNSRERKRQEVELLQAEKDKIEDDLRAAQHIIAQMSHELKAFRDKFPGALPEHAFETNTSMDAYESLLSQSNTICPRQTSFPSPVSMDSMDSPRDDSCQPETPFSESACPELDTTRYPAAILCDLQSSLQTTVASCDAGFPYNLQPHNLFDEKPLESLFDFDQFPEHTQEPTSMGDQTDFFSSAIFEHSSNSYSLSDQFDVKNFDLQTAPGAAIYASDEALAVEI